MLPSKSRFAFEQSVNLLYEKNPRIYFWTFTFRKVPICDRWAMFAFHSLCRRFHEHWPLAQGLRVSELHKSHGLHFHLLINYRISLQEMLRLAKPWGFGRLHVIRSTSVSAGFYLAKYLTKTYSEKNPIYSGHRRWGAVGGFRSVKCRDIYYETDYTRNKATILPDRQFQFPVYLSLLNYSQHFGLYRQWPVRVQLSFQSILKYYESI